MEPFHRLTGVAAPYARDNVDTDAIIPAIAWREAGTDRSRLADYLFYDARFDASGKENPSFMLNRPAYRRTQILVAADNFGCGSAREHAPWALLAFGIRAVVASSFGDIFYNNCVKNGLLPVTLAAAPLARLRASVERAGGAQPVSIDLEAQSLRGPDGESFVFEVDPVGREMLLEGLDEIGFTLRFVAQIDAFQARQRESRPWVYSAGFDSRG
jgi:3-isopropylmalate/(R)-2-methylmalate dehydratase small subunit